jgi:hypothetical protein
MNAYLESIGFAGREGYERVSDEAPLCNMESSRLGFQTPNNFHHHHQLDSKNANRLRFGQQHSMTCDSKAQYLTGKNIPDNSRSPWQVISQLPQSKMKSEADSTDNKSRLTEIT